METKNKSFYLEGSDIGVLLLHGFTGSPSEFRETGEFLHEHGLTVYAPLLPGHGTTPADLNNRKWHEWCEEAVKGLEKLQQKCKRIFVCGLSFGGTIALSIAANHNINGAVVMAASTRSIHKWVFILPLISKFKKYKKKTDFNKTSLQRFTYDCYPLKAVVEAEKFLKSLNKNLAKITAPLLLIYSRKDRTVSIDHSNLIMEKTGSHNKKLILLENSHHIITMGQDKERVNGEILEFIQQNR